MTGVRIHIPGLTKASADGIYVPRQATAPDHTVTTLYVDTSVTPPLLKAWDGAAWVIAGLSAVTGPDGSINLYQNGVALV